MLFFFFIMKTNYESVAYHALSLSKSKAKIVRKVTTWTIGLWPPNVHNDIFFCIIDDVVVISV